MKYLDAVQKTDCKKKKTDCKNLLIGIFNHSKVVPELEEVKIWAALLLMSTFYNKLHQCIWSIGILAILYLCQFSKVEVFFHLRKMSFSEEDGGIILQHFYKLFQLINY